MAWWGAITHGGQQQEVMEQVALGEGVEPKLRLPAVEGMQLYSTALVQESCSLAVM
jgi:hypothetical protein